MAIEKPAEQRSLKKLDELPIDSNERPKRLNLLGILKAVFFFIGGLGRVLKFIDDLVDWWNNSP